MHQCSVLSPLLFGLVMDVVSSEERSLHTQMLLNLLLGCCLPRPGPSSSQSRFPMLGLQLDQLLVLYYHCGYT